ncbi:MAG: dihydroneopterin aldolase [Fimbriimonadaceae bacterium]|nr:dihydroneopterin aldolase [Chitinophagales bacterium]
MGKLLIEGMQFKSHIGVYDYEQLYGNNFEVDVIIESELISGNTDEITDTIDYNVIYQFVKLVMEKKYNLIEFAANELLLTLVKNIAGAYHLQVRLTKLHPPLGGEVKKVSTEMSWTKG